MKILITGAAGNLGRRLTEDLSSQHEVLGLPRAELDITDFEKVLSASRQFQPDAIINSAAYNAVDRCEDEREKAFGVNAVGVRNLATAAHEAGARFVHFSTDFVFDGDRAGPPYTEYDEVHPLSVYAQSKRAGEVEAFSIGEDSIVLRLSWVYGSGGWNFTDWVAEEVGRGNEVQIVTDQFGSPTWVGDVSNQVQRLLEENARGLYHGANQGECARYDWARRIARITGADERLVVPIDSSRLNQKAPRPMYSVLDNFCLRMQRLDIMRTWEDALKDHFRSGGVS